MINKLSCYKVMVVHFLWQMQCTVTKMRNMHFRNSTCEITLLNSAFIFPKRTIHRGLFVEKIKNKDLLALLNHLLIMKILPIALWKNCSSFQKACDSKSCSEAPTVILKIVLKASYVIVNWRNWSITAEEPGTKVLMLLSEQSFE